MLIKRVGINWVSGLVARALIVFVCGVCLASPFAVLANEVALELSQTSVQSKVGMDVRQRSDSDLARGYQAMERGDYLVASDIFQEVLSYDSSNYWASLNLGVIYHVHGRITDARKYYENVVRNVNSAGKAFSASNARFVSSSASEIAAFNLALLAKIRDSVVEPSIESRSKKVFIVNFPFAKFRPSEDGFGQLFDSLPFIKQGSRVLISGFTDWNGSRKYNAWLAVERAKFVDQWVRSNQVSVETVLSGHGLCCYISSDSGRREAALSRRVEITVFAP